MAAAKHNLVIEQGVDFSLEITIKNANGAGIDLTSSTFTSKIRRSPETDAIQYSGSYMQFIASNKTNSGGVTFTLTAAKTAVLPGDNLIYDIFRTTSGSQFRDLEGEIEVIERITR